MEGGLTGEIDYVALNEQAMNELQLKTDAAIGLFHLDECRWDVDQDAGTITFTRHNGIEARAPVQIIGTFNPAENSWLWGWNHPSVVEPLQTHAETLRRYGEANGIAELATRRLQCTEEDCWRFAALACMMNEGQGAYRGPTEGPLVFMTYGALTLSNPNARRG
jgi:hypothetical protein